MDESTILRFLKESSNDSGFRSTESISAETNIDKMRVSVVCIKSKMINKNAKEKDLWYLNQ